MTRPTAPERALLEKIGFRESRNKAGLWSVDYEAVVVSVDFRRPEKKPFPFVFAFPKGGQGEFVDGAVLNGLDPVRAYREGLRALSAPKSEENAPPRAQESQPSPTGGTPSPLAQTREASNPKREQTQKPPAEAKGTTSSRQAGGPGPVGQVSLPTGPIVIRFPDDNARWHTFLFRTEDRDEAEGAAMEENLKIMKDCLDDARGVVGSDNPAIVVPVAVALFEKAGRVPHFEWERVAHAEAARRLMLRGNIVPVKEELEP